MAKLIRLVVAFLKGHILAGELAAEFKLMTLLRAFRVQQAVERALGGH